MVYHEISGWPKFGSIEDFVVKFLVVDLKFFD